MKDLKVSLNINRDVTQAKRRIIQRITNGDTGYVRSQQEEEEEE